MTGVPVFRAGRVYLGWQFAVTHPDPGPPPRRPAPPGQEQLDPGWLAAQRREERLLTRYWKVFAGVCLAAAALVLVLGTAGPLESFARAGDQAVPGGAAGPAPAPPETAGAPPGPGHPAFAGAPSGPAHPAFAGAPPGPGHPAAWAGRMEPGSAGTSRFPVSQASRPASA